MKTEYEHVRFILPRPDSLVAPRYQCKGDDDIVLGYVSSDHKPCFFPKEYPLTPLELREIAAFLDELNKEVE